ncbi:ead/Ea22-like family protein [Klebsiella quasipneumoniae]
MTTDITEFTQSEINDALAQLKQISEYPTPSTQYARVLRKYFASLVEALEKAQQRIAELENNEIQEEGNQFLVVRHPGKVPVIKHPVGELEDYLRQIFKADPLATIDIVTHRYYGVGGQFVEDADEYLHEMSIKVEAE